MDNDNSSPQAGKDTAKADDKKDTETLVVAGPFFTSRVVLTDKDGGTLEFDREHGTEVPAADADDLIAQAALAGVLLNRK